MNFNTAVVKNCHSVIIKTTVVEARKIQGWTQICFQPSTTLNRERSSTGVRMNLSYVLTQIMVLIPRQTNMRPDTQRDCNEPIKSTSSMNPHSLSRQAQLASAIARYNMAETEHKHATRHATLSKENLYFNTKPCYKFKWAQDTQILGVC